MRNTLLAAVIGAAIAASIVVVVRPSGNEANAQAKPGYSKDQAECMLRFLDKARTEKAVGILFAACKALHN